MYSGRGVVLNGTGVWARMVMERFPLLPVEEEGRLGDPEIRENFIERVFVFKRWRDLNREGKSLDGLVRFHVAHTRIVTARSPEACRKLDTLVAAGSGRDPEDLFEEYLVILAAALKLRNRA